MRIKAVVTDVDGTITDYEDRLGVEALLTIRKLEDSGVKVILCSGNALCVLKALGRYMGCSGPTVAENGGVVDYKGHMHILCRVREGGKAVQRLREEYGDKIKESWSNRYRFVDMAILRTIGYAEVVEVVKGFKGMKVMDSGFAYHIMDETVDKGVGVAKALSLLGLCREEAAGVGDSITDLELLQACGYKAIVANGDKRLEGSADYVAKEKFGKGFAEIAEKILSMRKA
jgi:phosphoglycolate phosphatase (TIGR01487 family)